MKVLSGWEGKHWPCQRELYRAIVWRRRWRSRISAKVLRSLLPKVSIYYRGEHLSLFDPGLLVFSRFVAYSWLDLQAVRQEDRYVWCGLSRGPIFPYLRLSVPRLCYWMLDPRLVWVQREKGSRSTPRTLRGRSRIDFLWLSSQLWRLLRLSWHPITKTLKQSRRTSLESAYLLSTNMIIQYQIF